MSNFKRINKDLVLLKRIGSGGMGEVFLGKRIGYGGFEKAVAVKCYYTEKSTVKSAKDFFIREATIGARLKHPNIIEIYDFGESQDSLYMSMEFVAGKQCNELLHILSAQDLNLPISVVLYIVELVANGLAYAHTLKDELTDESLNLIHRDISPQNMMVSYDGGVKLLDFGIAKIKTSRELTPQNSVLGKHGYLAPEQVEKGISSQASDVFSLGVCMYELVTGEYLFDGETTMEILRSNTACEIPKGWNDEFPEEIIKISDRMLEKDLDVRFSSADQFSKDLARVRKQHYPDAQDQLVEIMKDAFAEEIASEAKDRKELWTQEESKRGQTEQYVPNIPKKLTNKSLSDSSRAHQIVKLDVKEGSGKSGIELLGKVGPFKKK